MTKTQTWFFRPGFFFSAIRESVPLGQSGFFFFRSKTFSPISSRPFDPNAVHRKRADTSGIANEKSAGMFVSLASRGPSKNLGKSPPPRGFRSCFGTPLRCVGCFHRFAMTQPFATGINCRGFEKNPLRNRKHFFQSLVLLFHRPPHRAHASPPRRTTVRRAPRIFAGALPCHCSQSHRAKYSRADPRDRELRRAASA